MIGDVMRKVGGPRSILVLLGLALLGVAFTAGAAPAGDVAYRRIDVQDSVTSEMFPVALRYPTRAAPAPVFLTGSLATCGLPAMLCRLVAFEMQVAVDAAPADGKFGLVVISHGAAGLALNHRDLAIALASHGCVVAVPTHPRGKDNDISGVSVWVGRPKQVARVIDVAAGGRGAGRHIQRERIGVVGHSNGGYTSLAVAGARASPRPSVGTAASIRMTPGSAPPGAPRRGKAPGRPATFRMSAIPGCAPWCSWRRMPRPSPTRLSHR